jgi:hypothetical protein
MQDRYAGDVGDFGKFALLRYLFSNANYKIGVIWYRFPDESHNNDGSHVDYVNKSSFLGCDKYLCERLSTVLSGKRSVASLEEARLLPSSTVYFSELLDFHLKYSSQNNRDKEEREVRRKDWLKRAIQSVSDCNVIFVDPDNGLQIASCPKINQMRSGKFAYYPEIMELAKGKEVCVIYHHLNHHKKHGTHESQIRIRAGELREQIKPTRKVFALRYRPYSPRAYFILTSKSEEIRIKKNLNNFKLYSPYVQHWDSYYETQDL